PGCLARTDEHGDEVTGIDREVCDLHLGRRIPLPPGINIARDRGATLEDLALHTCLAHISRSVPIDPYPVGAVVPLILLRRVDIWNDPISLDPFKGLACRSINDAAGPIG